MTRTLISFQYRLRALVASRGDRGQGTLEYIGILAVVVALVVAVAGIISGQQAALTQKVTTVLQKIVGIAP